MFILLVMFYSQHHFCTLAAPKGKEKKGRKSSVQENESISRESSEGRGGFLLISINPELPLRYKHRVKNTKCIPVSLSTGLLWGGFLTELSGKTQTLSSEWGIPALRAGFTALLPLHFQAAACAVSARNKGPEHQGVPLQECTAFMACSFRHCQWKSPPGITIDTFCLG